MIALPERQNLYCQGGNIACEFDCGTSHISLYIYLLSTILIHCLLLTADNFQDALLQPAINKTNNIEKYRTMRLLYRVIIDL